MESSTTYVALETMIEQHWEFVQYFDFEKTLGLLEQKGLITAKEHQDLLELAKKMRLSGA